VGTAAEFVRAARSVRLQVRDGAAEAAREVEILCPDRVRVIASTTSGRLEVVAVGAQAYGRTGEGAWIKVPLSFVKAPAICRGATWQDGQDLPSLLQALTERELAEKPVGPRAVSGVACQDWEAREKLGRRQGAPPILMCLGISDRRPMQIALPDATWTFTEWNADLQIQEPEIVKGQPAAVVLP
jgi:hypothetical protein